MSTSVQSGTIPAADVWQLDLTPVVETKTKSKTRGTGKRHIHKLKSVLTQAEIVTGDVQALDELVPMEDCWVSLRFDSAAHRERAVELLGLIASSSCRGGEIEARDIHHMTVQLDRLEAVLRKRLAFGKQNKQAGLPELRKKLIMPLRKLRGQIAKASEAARELNSPKGLLLPDLQQTWMIRQKLIAQIGELRRQWEEFMPVQSAPAMTSGTTMSAWHRSLNQLWSQLSPGPPKPSKLRTASPAPDIDEVWRCFSKKLPHQAEELSLQVDLGRFLGGAVLVLCRHLNEANAKPQKMDLTKRWHELLKVCRELHFDSGCLRFVLVCGLPEDDPRAVEGQELLETTREALKEFLKLALDGRAEQFKGPISGPVEHRAPPAPDPVAHKTPDEPAQVPDSSASSSKGGDPGFTLTDGGATNLGAVQTSNRPPPGSASGDGPAEKRDALIPEVTANRDTPAAAPSSRVVSTTMPRGSNNTPAGGGVAMAAAAVPPAEERSMVLASGSKITTANDAQIAVIAKGQAMPAASSSQIAATCSPMAAREVQPAKRCSVEAPHVVKIKITKAGNGKLQVLHITADKEDDVSRKTSVMDSMLAFLVFKGHGSEGTGKKPAALKMSYQEYFNLCFPPLKEEVNYDNFKRVIQQRIARLKKYLPGLVIEDDGVTEFIVRNLILVQPYNIKCEDVATILKARAKR